MTISAVRVPVGPAATAWLRGRIAALQAGDPLAPVTVIVPTHHAGLHLRHRLAASGYAGVRFTVLSRLAEMLGAARLGGEGLLPLTAPVRSALVRSALRTAGDPLAASAGHAGLVDLVAALAAELRRRPDAAGDAERVRATANPTALATLDAVTAFRTLCADHRRYDDVDLLAAATAAVGDGSAAAVLRDVGAVVVHLPDRLDPPSLRFLDALAAHTAVEVALADVDGAVDVPGLDSPRAAFPDPPLTAPPSSVTIALDAVEEVRSAVRDALAAAERDRAVPLHRQAIVYRDADSYGALLRDTLILARIPYSSLDGRPLADTVPARALLGVLRLRRENLSRASVLGWLSGIPHGGGVLRSQARWDQLSRQAGVVRGLDQWVSRMRRLAEERRRELDYLEHDDSDEKSGSQTALRMDIEHSERIVEHIQAIWAMTAPPAEQTWAAHVAWIHRIRDEILTPDRAWGDADLEASQLVAQIVDGLGAAADVEPAVDVDTVLRSLEDALRARSRPEGRTGGGILIGPHRDLLGFDLDRVHVLGALEGAIPASPRVDPLLAGDPLDRRPEHEAEERRDWQVALGAAGVEVVVSAPTVDADGRTVYPSPWLLDLLATDAPRPGAAGVRAGTEMHPRLRRVSALGADDRAAPPLTIAERREREALRAHEGRVEVRDIALARRDDLPLGRTLRVASARRSRELTEFDGNLASAAAESALLAGGLTARVQSATGVQQWATCPFRYLLGRMLRVAATEEADEERWWQIDAAERGTLIHRILEDFFGEVARNGDPPPGIPYTTAHLDRITEIAERHFRDAEDREITGHRLVWANERATILRDLRSLLDVDAEGRGEAGWVPALFEQPFGIEREQHSWPALEVPIRGGRAVRLCGYMDRLDTAAGRARVIDYKTGQLVKETAGVENRLDHGRRLQLPVYALATREQWQRDGRGVPVTTALYWYATSRGQFRSTSVEMTPELEDTLVEVLALVDAGVRSGCFAQVPGDFEEHYGRCSNCRYCDYDAVCPASRDLAFKAKHPSVGMAPFRDLAPDDVDAENGDAAAEVDG